MTFFTIAVTAILTLMASSMSNATEFHISPKGDDGAAGTAAAPFSTLERARDAARETMVDGLPAGGITIWLHEGLYQLEESFALDERDSGSDSSPISYRAVDGEQVRLSGGRQIAATALGPVTTADIRQRLGERARDQVLAIDLKTLGVQAIAQPPISFRGAALPELFATGERMPIARWPNEGWVTMGEIIDRGSRTGADDIQKGGTFVYEGERPSRWSIADGVWLQGYWCWDWYEESIRIASIDTTAHSITLAAPHPYGIGYDPDYVWADSPRKFFALNLLEELDQPGEWYLDTSSLILYMWPRDGSIVENDLVLSILQEPLVTMESVSHVSFEGITFETSRGTAIEIREGAHNRIAACTFRNLAQGGVAVSGGTDHLVVGCDIYDVGSFGISLTGGDRQTLTPGRHTALNNHIHHFARLQRTYAGAVHLNGVGNRAAHNLIHDAPHLGMEFIGNDHLIEYNHIHHIAQETGDVVALYTGRDWSARGTVIRYNFMHDLLGTGVVGSMGVYLDDCICGTEVYGNIIHKATYALHSGGGRDNVFRNNIVTESKHAVHIDTRCADIEAVKKRMPIYWERLEAVPYREPPWSERYPELVDILDDDLGMPKRNVVERNVAVACGEEWLHVPGMEPYLDQNRFENNLELATYEEAGFVDADALDLRLREDSIVFDEVAGFEQIPFDEIGLYEDEFRKRLSR